MAAQNRLVATAACAAVAFSAAAEAVTVSAVPGRFFFAWVPCGAGEWECRHAAVAPSLPSFASIERDGRPFDRLLVYGTAPNASATTAAATFTVTAGGTRGPTTVVNIAPAPAPAPASAADGGPAEWDELLLTVTSHNVTQLLAPPLPPAGLATLEQGVASAAGASGTVLVAVAHAVSGPPRNVPPPLAGGQWPNWWLGRASNVTFAVPRARSAAPLTCAGVEAAWAHPAFAVNFSAGGCTVRVGVGVPGGNATAPGGDGTDDTVLGGPSGGSTPPSTALGSEDWSRSTDGFNATVGVACIVAAVVVVAATVWALWAWHSRRDSSATATQATRQIRRDVVTVTKWNVYPNEGVEAKEFLRDAKGRMRRRSTTSILLEEPYPNTGESAVDDTGLPPSPPPPPQYRPPPPASPH